MGKRKREESDDILKKLEEIQAQLHKRSRRRVRRISSEETSNSSNEENAPSNILASHSMPVDDQRAKTDDVWAAIAGPSTSSKSSIPERSSHGQSDVPPPPLDEDVIVGPSTSTDQGEQSEITLDDEILQLLGDAPKTDTILGPNVHKDIASRWQEILTKGLPKETKEKILKDHLVPTNCALLVSPLLNAEVKAALPESLIKRDSFLAERQKQIGIALAALSNAMEMLIKKNGNSYILKTISDAARILCDVHFNETKSRRSFIISATNTNMKETLMDTKRDKYLFGENVSEILKSAKNIQKSGADLKKIQRNTNPKFNKNNFYKNKSLNTRGPQRKTSGNPDVGKPRAPATAAATTTRSSAKSSSTQRKHSPPHKNSRRRY